MSAGGFAHALAPCLLLAVLFAALARVAVVDVRERRIPNALCIVIALTAILQMVASEGFGVPVLSAFPAATARVAWGVGVLVVGCAFEALWRLTHDGSHGMGLGDVKLASALALWVGPAALVCIAAACLLASLVNLAMHRRSFAFGPYLAMAFGTCLLVMALAPRLCASGTAWW